MTDTKWKLITCYITDLEGNHAVAVRSIYLVGRILLQPEFKL